MSTEADLLASLDPALPPDDPTLEGLSLEQLDALRSTLLGNAQTLDELDESQLVRLLAINARMRLTARTASKPKANGGRRGKTNERSADELLDF